MVRRISSVADFGVRSCIRSVTKFRFYCLFEFFIKSVLFRVVRKIVDEVKAIVLSQRDFIDWKS